jgi:hypothetical protein
MHLGEGAAARASGAACAHCCARASLNLRLPLNCTRPACGLQLLLSRARLMERLIEGLTVVGDAPAAALLLDAVPSASSSAGAASGAKDAAAAGVLSAEMEEVVEELHANIKQQVRWASWARGAAPCKQRTARQQRPLHHHPLIRDAVASSTFARELSATPRQHLKIPAPHVPARPTFWAACTGPRRCWACGAPSC